MESLLEKHVRSIVQQVLSTLGETDSISRPTVKGKKPLIAANWKMNMTLGNAEKWFRELNSTNYSHCDIICCPSFPLLYPLREMMRQHGFAMGAQNIHGEPKGAFTGEVQGELLADMGCEYVLIGHSERRSVGETNEHIVAKLEQAAANQLTPILCVGETERQRKQGIAKETVRHQVVSAFDEAKAHNKLIIAYEPVWAIGTGQTASPSDAQDMHRFIRQVLAEHRGQSYANEVAILYGGSANASNINELCAMEDIDGALVGGASLDAHSFESMLEKLQ